MNPIASVIQDHSTTKNLSDEDKASLVKAIIKELERHTENIESLFDIDKEDQEDVVLLSVIIS